MKSIRLSIPEPCHENWDQMLPEEQGKFCLRCQKTVVDFSAMSDREIIEYFSSYQGKTCGRFNNEQLDRTLSIPKKRSVGRWKYFWQILIPAIFVIHKVDAQPKVGKSGDTTCVAHDSTYQILGGVSYIPEKAHVTGKVVDSDGKPIPNATITLENTKINAKSNMKGDFVFKELELPFTLVITALGYETNKIVISSDEEALNMRIILSHRRRMGMVAPKRLSN